MRKHITTPEHIREQRDRRRIDDIITVWLTENVEVMGAECTSDYLVETLKDYGYTIISTATWNEAYQALKEKVAE